MKSRWASAAGKVAWTGLGVSIVLGAAVLASAAFSRVQPKEIVPVIFAVVPIAVSGRFGRVAGILGSFLSVPVLARNLFASAASLRPLSSAAHGSLAWMLLISVVVSYLLFPPVFPPDTGKRHRNA